MVEIKGISNVSSADALKIYREARRRFTAASVEAAGLSATVLGSKASHKKEVLGSHQFTRMVLLSMSVLRLCPRVEPMPDRRTHWDFGAAAALVRCIYECYLQFYYVALDSIAPDEWEARYLVMQLRDAKSRQQLLELGEDRSDVPKWGVRMDELRQTLKTNPFFLTLSPNRQTDLLRGDRFCILSNSEIMEKARIDNPRYLAAYRFFSAYVHSTPLSYFRAHLGPRGRGDGSPADMGYMALALEFGLVFLQHGIEGMKTMSGKQRS